MKEQAELQPIADTYLAYKKNKETISDSLELLEGESDEEMREMLKEELAGGQKKKDEELERQLKILLLPKDPNDSKNVIVEIRAGAGGDEAALFAAEIYRMYVKYAESRRWRTEMLSLNENGLGGFKEADVPAQRQRGLLPAEIRKRRAPGAAGAGDRERGPDPHLHHHSGHHAGGGGDRFPSGSERLPV